MTSDANITATLTAPLPAVRALQGAAGQWANELEQRERRTDDLRLRGLLRKQAERIRSSIAAVETALEGADFNEEGEDPCTCAPVAGPHPGCAEFADDRDVPCPSCQAAYEDELAAELDLPSGPEPGYVVTFTTPAGRILAQHSGPLPDVQRFRDHFQATLASPLTAPVAIEAEEGDVVEARHALSRACIAFDAAQYTADAAFRRFLHDPSSHRQGYATRTARALEEATARWDEAADALARLIPTFDTIAARQALLQ